MGRAKTTAIRPLTAEERAALERIARARSERADRVGWAKMLLAVADGEGYAEVARKVGRRSPDSVTQLVTRWNALGIDALGSKATAGDGKLPAKRQEGKTTKRQGGEAAKRQGIKAAGGAAPLGAGSPLVAPLLHEAMALPGALAAALVDLPSGIVLDRVGGGGFDLDRAGHGNAEVLRAKLRVKERLGIRDEIEDILITLGSQYHLLRVVAADPSVFIYFVLEREQAQLAMARRALHQMERLFSLGRALDGGREFALDEIEIEL